MHPRAIVGPPGTMPHLNPDNGMPALRRTLPRVGNPMLQFGAGAPQPVPASSVPIDAPPIQANPVRTLRRGRTKITFRPSLRGGRACPPHMHWDDQTKQCVPDTTRNPACHEDGIVFPNPACHEDGVVSVGACFPKFDPLQMYGVGHPPAPVQNPLALQAPYQFPALDAMTGLPRLRGSSWTRR